VRYLYTDGEQIGSDLYYQCLDGSYNSDGDKYWGEPTDGENGGDVDLLAEVYVGRISAENAEEMANGVYKILAYEQESDTAEYLRRSCMVGEELGSQFGPGEFGFAHPFMNEIKNGSSAAGYTTAGFKACPLFTVDSLDDYDAYWPVDSLISLINSNKYSILNHLGHANTDYVMKMNVSDADNLKNTKYIFALSQGCLPGYFTSDCIAEHLTTSTRSGLFAGVFNYHYGWGAYNDNYENLDAPSQRLNRQFWDAYFGEYIYNVGRLNADSHEDNLWDINGDMIRWCVYETNLFGDPFTVIRGQIEGAKIVLNNADISDISGGNGDGIVNPGEEIDITLFFKNVGNKIGKGIIATISETDPYVSFVNGSLSFGDINCCGAVKTSENRARLSISSDCPTPYTFPLTVEISDNEGNSWLETFNITVYTSYKISGQVLTLTGSNAIVGAKVKISGPKSGIVTTNNNGEYVFVCFDGVYKVHATAQGYLPADDTIIVTIPPDAENIDFYLGRPELTVEPANITSTLQVNDSAVVPLKILNSGDKDLLVTPDARSVSIELKKRGTPQIIHFDSSKVKKGNKYSDFIGEKKPNL
ncbi:MAG: C25 family cysteine peptidase, partial [Chitinispirillaceae bacterium]|nr:C25 family cysteine peptidase [Chitinispirillaceae bacterium]